MIPAIQVTNKLNELFNKLNNKGYIKQFSNSYSRFGSVFVRFEALEKKDYPNSIRENGKYVIFEIDSINEKVSLYSCGHIWLSEEDKNNEKYKYYAMRSMIEIAESKGIKRFRKCKIKSIEETFNKMNLYFQNVMDKVNEYSGGYPYSPKNW